MTTKDLYKTNYKACPQLDIGGCSVTWDRKGNVKSIEFCRLHNAAPQMVEALQSIVNEHIMSNNELSRIGAKTNPPKPTVKKAIEALQSAGVEV